MVMLLMMVLLLPMLLLFHLPIWLRMWLLLLQPGDVGPAFAAVGSLAQKLHEKRSSSRILVVLTETLHEGIALSAIAVVLFV